MARLRPETKVDLVRRLLAGESASTISAHTGLSIGTAEKKIREFGRRPAAAAPAPAPAAASSAAVPPASGPDALTGSVGMGEVGGLDAARMAAGSSPPPPAGAGAAAPLGGASGASGEALAAEPNPTPEEDVKAVIAFAQTLTVLSCRGFVAVRRVKIDGRILARLSILSPEEVAQLRLFAPAAAPYMRELLKKQKEIAAVVFAVSWVLMVAGKFGTIKEQGVVMPPVRRPDPAAEAPAPAPPGAL